MVFGASLDLRITNVACQHNSEHRIMTATHEIVCKACGVVLEMDNSQEVNTESTINLFQEIAAGCKPVKLESCMRIHEPKLSSSSFSNACDKLNLPRYVSIDAWNIFVKLTKNQHKKNKTISNIHNSSLAQNSIRLSNGVVAMFSIFVSCRRFSMSKSESEIQNAVKLSFSLKHLPTMLKVFSLVKPLATELGIKSDESHLDYYLNVYLKKFKKRDMYLLNGVKQQAKMIADNLPGTDESKARNAVKVVLAGLGNKFA
jgi:transcription initiation factor TFIIIB Brf1 subunit/transcription initiation factor TFIIB